MAKRKSTKGQTTQWPREKVQSTIYKTLQHSPYFKPYYYHFTVLMYNENVFY
jgi:hypothetical protein